MALQGDQLTGVEFIPYLINAPCVPTPFQGSGGQYLADKLQGCPATDDNGRREGKSSPYALVIGAWNRLSGCSMASFAFTIIFTE